MSDKCNCLRIIALERENAELREFRDRAMEHIDDLQVIVADQKEKLHSKPREGSIQAKIRERQKREFLLSAEAHRYLRDGPRTEKQYVVRGPEELCGAINDILQAVGRSKTLVIRFQEVAR